VLALATLGYGYLSVLIVGLLCLIAVFGLMLKHAPALGVKLILLPGALLVVVLRSLWVRLEPPAGEVLRRREAPGLFTRVEQLCRRLRAPRVHRVIVTEDFNAAVTQVPRLGVLGWHRNYLLLGLPLLKCLTVEQLEAVLAHELGHLSGGHARLG